MQSPPPGVYHALFCAEPSLLKDTMTSRGHSVVSEHRGLRVLLGWGRWERHSCKMDTYPWSHPADHLCLQPLPGLLRSQGSGRPSVHCHRSRCMERASGFLCWPRAPVKMCKGAPPTSPALLQPSGHGQAQGGADFTSLPCPLTQMAILTPCADANVPILEALAMCFRLVIPSEFA